MKILVAEADSNVAQLIARRFARAGHHVTITNGPTSTGSVLAAYQPDLLIVGDFGTFTDFITGEFDRRGVDFGDRCHAAGQKTIVISRRPGNPVTPRVQKGEENFLSQLLAKAEELMRGPTK
jgi:hypothetical protein